ncbi:M23 family metallopeptidase [Methylophilaceae bacterium]|jgi:murein DD-endopeptidase MepM/ murein hydrolase activator NlpD|nr:M23 family metallopeptidase [Methylophilaceae bacterium]|tara:strand:+ start:64 stop:957 length:894 start_codon:yes stop_codon:yes gene_type:complete
MKIIFIGKETSKPKTISFTFFVFTIFLLCCLAIFLFNYYLEYKKINSEKRLENFKLTSETLTSRYDFDIYVEQIGELYSRILDIDQQTERLQDIIKKQILGKEKLPKLKKEDKLDGKGGPFIGQKISHNNIQKNLGRLMQSMKVREEIYNRMEAILLNQSVLRETLPSLYPVNVPYTSSSYGWRRDPILGKRAMHEGIDFSAAHGESIYATAGGIVVYAGKKGAYGNLVTINHGGGLQTRYAHISKILVKKGDIVKKQDLIAFVGNTGRSTGPHLHYEIRLNKKSLDPKQYLKRKIK